MAKGKTYRFSAVLSTLKGAFISTVIFIPDQIVRQLPKGRLRTEGSINGTSFALAIQFKKDGRRFFMVSQTLRRSLGIKAGDAVKVEFKIVDPDKLELPEELDAVLAQDDEGRKMWASFTRGIQRGLAHYVGSVKNVDSRIKRALEIVEKGKLRQLHFQKIARDKNKNP